MSGPAEAPREPELSVVIPTLGNYGGLRRVLDAYSTQDAPPESFELLVVADLADPDPAAVDEAIGTRPYPIRRLTGNLAGASANRNTGWRAASAPLILFTDNDTIPVPSLVSEHLAWHRRHPSAETAVLGHVRWAKELRMTPFMRWLDHGIQFDFPSIKGVEAGWGHLYSANSSLKRRFIERVGGWDEERLPYLYEDIDWAYRASRFGLRVVYNRRAVVDHLRHDATLEFWKRKVRRLAAVERDFVRIHPEMEPYFFELFSSARRQPRVRGRGERLARFVPRSVPWLGPRVWSATDLAYRQALAPHFLSAWEEADEAAAGSPQLGRSELERSSAGSSPGGPK
jgi:GT2 family glycosyltransferase